MAMLHFVLLVAAGTLFGVIAGDFIGNWLADRILGKRK